jgi:hypothetical protein
MNTAMLTRLWLGIIAAVGTLIIMTVWLFSGARSGPEAVAAILQAQRDISAVQEIHVKVDPAALRTAETHLFAAHAAFNAERYEVATEAALRASRAARALLVSGRSLQNR